MPPTSSSEDRYGLSSVPVLARGLPVLSGAALASWLAPSSTLPLTSRKQTHPVAPSAASPRSPLDCPSCRLACTPSPAVGPASAPIRPWSEVKSRRGAPKRVETEGFACPNQQCAYFGITDAHIHALVGDGKHGQAERIQTFRGPACGATFSSRRKTALYRLKTPSQQIAMVLSVLAEGLDASAAERVAGLSTTTITSLSHSRWATRTVLARTLLLQSSAPASAAG